MRLLLDTNVYSDLMRGREAVAVLIRRAHELLLSSVVLGELLYGFRLGSRLERNLEELDVFLGSAYVTLLPVTRTTADRYSRIASALRRKATPIPTNDIWIAAHAMETGADLVSSDQHFELVDGLAWVRP